MQKNCPECGHSVTSRTTWCPGCERRLRVHPVIRLVLWLLFLGAFVGWEVSTGTDEFGHTSRLSQNVVIPFLGPISPDRNENPEQDQADSFHQIATQRTYAYGLYRDEPVVRR
jgi:hypothetical protein